VFRTANRPSTWAVLIVVAFGLSAAACNKDEAPAGAAAQQAPPQPAPYVTVAPQAIVIEDTLPGRVVAVREAHVRPQVGGILRDRLFTEGDDVVEGQELYQIDADMFRADVSAARSQRARSQAALKLAEAEAERAEQMSESGISSGRELDTATTNLELARADLQATTANLRRSSLNLAYAKVVAPIAGRIGISRVSEGALVSPADPQPLTVIQQIDEVYVDVKQPLSRYEELKHMLAAGELEQIEDVEVTILSMQNRAYPVKGKFLFTDTAVDPVTSEVTLRVLVPNPDFILLPGMFVRASIPQGVASKALTIPQQAVRHDATFGAFVYVIDETDTIQIRHVAYGRVIDGNYIVTEGVEAGDRVVTEGHSALRPEMVVAPVEWQAADDAPQQL